MERIEAFFYFYASHFVCLTSTGRGKRKGRDEVAVLRFQISHRRVKLLAIGRVRSHQHRLLLD